jgi:hypothetical protein
LRLRGINVRRFWGYEDSLEGLKESPHIDLFILDVQLPPQKCLTPKVNDFFKGLHLGMEIRKIYPLWMTDPTQDRKLNLITGI